MALHQLFAVRLNVHDVVFQGCRKDMEWIEQAGVSFRSLTEAIDRNTTAGRMLMQLVSSSIVLSLDDPSDKGSTALQHLPHSQSGHR
jgi:hypothetical protein